MVIWWIRRDLRLQDNAALRLALAQSNDIVPVFIFDPQLLGKAAEKRKLFLFAGLRRLAEDLRQRRSCLICRTGPPEDVLRRVMQESDASAIYCEEDYSPYARSRDDQVRKNLPVTFVPGLTIHPPDWVKKPNGEPYTVFTPFSKAWKAVPVLRVPDLDLPERFSTPTLVTEPIPEGISPLDFPAGELAGARRLRAFLDGAIYEYAEGRNRLDWEGTSRLSPYFRFGMLSASRAYAEAQPAFASAGEGVARQGVETWMNELIWREFYQAILLNFPQVTRKAFNASLQDIPWRDDPDDLSAWQQGITGYPVVDAAMRQLAETGWMHNRARMIAASFLVKDLLINWQAGEAWFMQHLVDGDVAANNGGWQWTAGVGTDAAPYFRIFNPVSQGIKHDPEGNYVRRWVPELRRVPLEHLHQPWLMPMDVQESAGCIVGRHYPAPVVDHQIARESVLQVYKAAQALAKK